MPFITLEAALEMFILFLLQQVIVVPCLSQIIEFVVGAILANLLCDIANGCFVFANKFGILDLFALVYFNELLFFRKFSFEFTYATN